MSDDPERPAARKKLEADVCVSPQFRHGLVVSPFAQRTGGYDDLEPADFVSRYADLGAVARSGDLGLASNILTAQALTLDAVFTDMLSRANKNLGQYPDAADRFMRLAMKAQAQSRATVEALAKMHQPREQTVKHVHIDNRGGQAVVAERVQTGGREAEYVEQSCGPTGTSPIGAAMLSQDTAWHGMPLPSDEGAEPMPHSRGEGRGAEGK